MQRNGVGKASGEVVWIENGEKKVLKAGAIPLMIPSSKDRIAGWTIMHQYLNHNDLIEPQLRYFRNGCKDSIRTIPTLVHYDPTRFSDPKRLEDLDTGGEDHAADVDRYFLQTLRNPETKQPYHVKTEAEVNAEWFNKKVGKINEHDPLGLSRFQV